jgi:ribonuclease P protein component
MLARQYRLPLNSQTRFEGKRMHTPFFIVVVAPSSGSYGRAGVVLPKKHQRHAVVRNQTKRMVMDVVQSFLKNTPIDLLFISKPSITLAPKEEVKKAVEDVLTTIQNPKRLS